MSMLMSKEVLAMILYSYGKYPNILYTKGSDKLVYADSTDLDQMAPSGAVWSGSTLFVIPLSILRNNCIKAK